MTGPLPDGLRSLRSSAALLKGTFGFEGIGPMRDAAAEAIALELDPASPWHALARATYAAALYWSGDLGAAAAEADRALSAAGSIGIIRMLAFSILSLVAVDQEKLTRAEQLARSARDILADTDSGLAGAPQSSLAYTAVGAVFAQRGLLTEARQEFERALQVRRSQSGISPWATVEVLIRLSPVLSGTGDRQEAVALAQEARLLLTSAPDGAGPQLARLDQLERRLAGRPQAVPTGRSPHRARGGGATAAGRHIVGARDRPGTVSVAEHDQDPHQGYLPETRCLHPPRCHRPEPEHRHLVVLCQVTGRFHQGE